MNTATQPAITMRAFFALPEVVANCEVQKRHPHGSKEHEAAFDAIVTLAKTYGVDSFFEY